MEKELSGTFISDDVASIVGRFVLRFGYCEFLLLIYYNEVHGTEEKATEFLDLPLNRRVGKLKGGLERLNISTAERKSLLGMLDRFEELAHKRNLVCHNPYMTIPLLHDKHHSGAIFGARTAVQSGGNQIAAAKVSDLLDFDERAARLQAEFHQLFPVFQRGLPPKK